MSINMNCKKEYIEEYNKKLVTAEEAVKVVKSSDWVDYGWNNCTPEALDRALAKRLIELEDVKFRGSLLLKVPEIFKITDPEKHFIWNSWHMSSIERHACDQGFAFYAPIKFSEVPRYYRDSKDSLDVAMFQTAPMDSQGYFNFGPNIAYMKTMCQMAKVIIVEINNKMPICFGGELKGESIHISEVDMIVEGDNRELGELMSPKQSEVDKMVANLIVEEIPDGACLQLGIGAMPSAVGSLIAKSDLKNLGVHSEMYGDAYLDMAIAGKINGSCKNIDRFRQTFSFGTGTKRLYDYLNYNKECMIAPVDYTNDVRVISAIDNFVSINNAIDVDLFGQVNAESTGIRHISGAGGQLDFVIGAYPSKGGKSFICFSSTFKTKDGKIKSRILPTLNQGSIVTDTRANVHYLVTEYGKINLKGLTTWQRAEAIISIAHPDFREELIMEAEKFKIWRRSNKR